MGSTFLSSQELPPRFAAAGSITASVIDSVSFFCYIYPMRFDIQFAIGMAILLALALYAALFLWRGQP